MPRFSEALRYHSHPRPGKLEIRATKATLTQADLSLAYTPGVAEPCLAIHENPGDVFQYTNRGNLVAVVTNGTAVLGLGNIGGLASKPVMEGKGVLFKRFADIDVYDLEIDSQDPDDVIRFCELLAPTVGGINLEDIRAPDCFYIEETLRDRLDIPVFHDDQHGTAIIAGAALINAAELSGRRLEDMKVVILGAGAAGVATGHFLIRLGFDPERLLMVDSRGVLDSTRSDLNAYKKEFARHTDARTLTEALVGADALIGLAQAGLVHPHMLERMNPQPIVFPLANPDPEIPYHDAKRVRPDAFVGTGRSDYPNQVNNVLGFPFIFRGALDVRATAVSEGMKVAAAEALAILAREPVAESVLEAYQLKELSFGPDYLIPKPFDPRVLTTVAPAVAVAATEEGLARLPCRIEEYRQQLSARLRPSQGLIQAVTIRARQYPARVVFPYGDDLRLVRAARRVLDAGIAHPVLLADRGVVTELSEELGISLDGIKVVDPISQSKERDRYGARLLELRGHRGVSRVHAARMVFDPNVFAALMVESGDADVLVGGLTTFFPETVRPALQIIKVREGRTIASALYVVVTGRAAYFFADCAVNISPSAGELAEIAASAVDVAQHQFGRDPRVAFISYSDFGSAAGDEPARVRQAVELFRDRWPETPVDGEMQADTAVVEALLNNRRPGGPLKYPANILVFPNLTAANSAYKLLERLGDAEVIGPVLTGLSRSVQVLQRDASVAEIVNLTAYAVADARRLSEL
ncbi:MAG: NADP-dependent malic enzyme [Actinomycetia bacterium]|nr:NADP-dependent malic enzyme [Actinomycetes bacterium]